MSLAEPDPKSTRTEGRLVASLCEDRSRTVALVLIDTSTASSVEVHSFTDSAGYPETLELLDALVPDELLLPQGQQHGVLATKVTEWAESHSACTLQWMSIRDFDQTAGAEMLRSVVCGDLDPHFCLRYTVLAGAYCALRFVEKDVRSVYQPNTVKVRFVDNHHGGGLIIDRATSAALEILRNSRSGNQRESLFGVINHTRTSVGAQKLREFLLQPSADVATITARQDLVEILTSSEEMYVN